MQLHVLSFEGPDAYSRAGGLATRVEGLVRTLAGLRFGTHLWFIGDPALPGHESHESLHLHRWAQGMVLEIRRSGNTSCPPAHPRIMLSGGRGNPPRGDYEYR